MEYKLYRGYILGPGYQNPAYGIYEVSIFLHKEDVEAGNEYHTSESEWEAQLWLDGDPVEGTATQADVDELNVAHPQYPDYIMRKVRQHLGLESWDTLRDSEINSMTKHDVFTHCLEWEGIIGYNHAILRMIDDIYGAAL